MWAVVRVFVIMGESKILYSVSTNSRLQSKNEKIFVHILFVLFWLHLWSHNSKEKIKIQKRTGIWVQYHGFFLTFFQKRYGQVTVWEICKVAKKLSAENWNFVYTIKDFLLFKKLNILE